MALSSVVEFPATANASFLADSVKHRRNRAAATVLSLDSRPKLQAGDMAYTFDGSVVGQELVQLVRPCTTRPSAWEVMAVKAPLMCDDGNETWAAIVAEKCLRRASNLLRPVGHPCV